VSTLSLTSWVELLFYSLKWSVLSAVYFERASEGALPFFRSTTTSNWLNNRERLNRHFHRFWLLFAWGTNSGKFSVNVWVGKFKISMPTESRMILTVFYKQKIPNRTFFWSNLKKTCCQARISLTIFLMSKKFSANWTMFCRQMYGKMNLNCGFSSNVICKFFYLSSGRELLVIRFSIFPIYVL